MGKAMALIKRGKVEYASGNNQANIPKMLTESDENSEYDSGNNQADIPNMLAESDEDATINEELNSEVTNIDEDIGI